MTVFVLFFNRKTVNLSNIIVSSKKVNEATCWLFFNVYKPVAKNKYEGGNPS